MINLRNFLKKLDLGEQGFSMVQGLIAAAVIGGVSVAIVQQNKLTNQQTRAASTNLAIVELQGQIQNYLLSEGSCTSSFSGATLALTANDQSQPVTTIRDKLGTTVFQVGSKYNLNQVSIPSMRFTRTPTGGTLTVMFLKEGNDNGRGIGARNARKDYEVRATWDNTTGNLLQCYSDLSSAVDTAVAEVIAKFCPDPGAPNPTGIYFDSGTGLCESTAQFGTTAIQTDCPTDQAVTGLTYNSTTRQYSKVCNSIYTIPTTCPSDSLLRRRSNGTFDCVKPECPGNAIFKGLDASGNSQCVSCGNGQVAVVVSGSWSCQNIQCSNPSGQQYFMGFDTTGNPVCNNLIASSACPGGGRLVSNAGGNVTYECCTPSCGDSSTTCSGTVYNSSNGCGVCTGTKAQDCGDPSTQCVGSYPSLNGCGSCTGTKPSTPGTCSAPAATSDYRIKSGATCDCATSRIAQERRYASTCTLGTCGGLPGSAPDTWIEEGTQACTPSGCGCTATTSCTTIAAGICSGNSAGIDSCDVPCGMGTKNCAGGKCEWEAGPVQPGDPACWPVGDPILEVTCSSISDCPARPPSAAPCPAQPFTLLSCGGSARIPTRCVGQSPILRVGPDGCQRLEMYNILDQNGAIIEECEMDRQGFRFINGNCSKDSGHSPMTNCPALPNCPSI